MLREFAREPEGKSRNLLGKAFLWVSLEMVPYWLSVQLFGKAGLHPGKLRQRRFPFEKGEEGEEGMVIRTSLCIQAATKIEGGLR